MKVVIVGPSYPFRGGIAYFSNCLFRELEKDNNKTLLINFRQQYPKLLFPGKQQLEKESIFADIPSVRILTPYNPLTFRKTFRKILEFEPDIVIFNFFLPFFAPAYTYLNGKLNKKGLKSMILAHNIDFHEKWFMGNFLTRRLLNRSDYVVTLSDAVSRDAQHLVKSSKTSVIKGFHPLYYFHDKNNYTEKSAREHLKIKGKRVILFFGYIKPYKGVDILIRSFAALKRKFPDMLLLIIGEIYGNKQAYQELIDKFALDQDVILRDEYVGSDEVELYFKAADVLVLPYRQATQSGVIQTAYVMDLGVVVTPVGGLPEMIIPGKTGVIARSIDENALTEAIEQYFNMKPDYIKKNIQEYRRNFSWQKFVDLLKDTI